MYCLPIFYIFPIQNPRNKWNSNSDESLSLCFVMYGVRNVKSLWLLLYSFNFVKNFMMFYDGGLSASTRRHEPMESKNLRTCFGMNFGQPQAVKVSTNLLRVLVAK